MNQNKNSSARSREEKDQYPDPKGREISGLGRMIHFFRFFRFCRRGFFPFYFLLLVCHLTFQDIAIFFYFKRIGPFVNLISFWRVEFPKIVIPYRKVLKECLSVRPRPRPGRPGAVPGRAVPQRADGPDLSQDQICGLGGFP